MTGADLDWLDAREHDAALDADPQDEPHATLITTKMSQQEPDKPAIDRGKLAA